MNWLESLIYGLISGVTEFLPISSLAHQRILLKLFGMSAPDPVQDLFVHLALLTSLLIVCRSQIDQLRRANHLRINNRRGIRGNNDVLELRFLKNAALPLLIGYFVLLNCIKVGDSLILVTLFSFINALILFIPSRMMQGNKDERSMSVLDSMTVGLSGALFVFPGISRIAVMLSVASMRGIDKRKAVDWVLLLSAPALVLLSIVDIINIFSAVGRTQITGNILGYILSAIGAYAAGYVGVLLMRSMTANKDHSGFSFYALGVMLFSLFLYLSVV